MVLIAGHLRADDLRATTQLFDIPSQTIADALNEFSKQSGLRLLFVFTEVAGKRTAAIKGRYTPHEVLTRLLADAGLHYEVTADSVVVVKPTGAEAKPPADRSAALAEGARPARTRPAVSSADEEQSGDVIAGLEQVMVTAQKREESLQATPIAITALGSKDLETQRITNVMDLVNKASAITLAPFAGTRTAPNLFIRGMGNLNAQSTKDLATGIYIDGVPVARGMGLAADIADLERVEVLRGPQGTLWGRNTTAGAINFIPRKPGDELSFSAQLTVGSWDQMAGRARVNAPVADWLQASLAYMRAENDGWVENENTTLPNQINFNEDRKKEALRAATRFEPADSVVVDYAFDKSQMTFGNHFYQVVQGGAAPGRQESAPAELGLYPSSTKVSGHNVTVTWELNKLTVKSISAYRELDNDVYMNYIDAFTQDNQQSQHQFSQELQAIGEASHRVRYVAGLFYFREASRESIASVYAGGALVDSWRVTAQGTSAAIYGQVAWTPPVLDERLGLTLGVRYTEDSRRAAKTYVNADFTPEITGTVVQGDRRFDSLNPVVIVDYAFTDAIRGYMKYSTGYRAGGFNTQSTPAYFGAGFDQEDVEAWEAGLKSDLFNDRLRVNMAVFENRYTDLQVDQVRTPPIFTDTLNAGSAKVRGFELEAAAVLARGLSANVFYAYLDANYRSYVDNGVELASLRHMPNAPEKQLGVGLEYAFARTGVGDLILNVDYRYQSEFYSNPMDYSRSPSYEIWNARLQLADIPAQRGAFHVALWGRNLGDEAYRLSTTNLGMLSAQFGPPRSMGVDFMYGF
ncbi:MAG: TonB-dependent receptor [Steroidobacteraceae bacterium]|nr:TonB-dependent receptor [Steroidobacteraceae bacterium]